MSVVTGVSHAPFRAARPQPPASHLSVSPANALSHLCAFPSLRSQAAGAAAGAGWRRHWRAAAPGRGLAAAAAPGAPRPPPPAGRLRGPPAGAAVPAAPPSLSFLNRSTGTSRLLGENRPPLVRHPFTLKVLEGDCDCGPTYGQLLPLPMTRNPDKTHEAAVRRLWTKRVPDHCASDGICLRGGTLMGRAPQFRWFSVRGRSRVCAEARPERVGLARERGAARGGRRARGAGALPTCGRAQHIPPAGRPALRLRTRRRHRRSGRGTVRYALVRPEQRTRSVSLKVWTSGRNTGSATRRRRPAGRSPLGPRPRSGSSFRGEDQAEPTGPRTKGKAVPGARGAP